MRVLQLRLAPDLVALDDTVDRIEILSNQFLSDGSVVEMSRIDGDDDALGELITDNPDTIDFEVGSAGGSRYLYHHVRPGTDDPMYELISLLDDHRLLVVYPIVLDRRHGAAVTLVGPSEGIQAAFDRLPAEIRRFVTIEHLTESVPAFGDPRGLLTGRQREVLDAANECGYYAIPRRATSSDVAAAVGCAPSTAAEHLRKIESRILSGLTREV